MASPTQQTSLIRERKKTRHGNKRKAALRTKGTTKSKKDLFQDKE